MPDIKNKKNLSFRIIDIFNKYHNKPLNYKQLAKRLGIKTPATKQLVLKKIDALMREGLLIEEDRGKYKLKDYSVHFESTKKYITGKIEIISSGAAYVVPDPNENNEKNGTLNDIYIPASKTLNAFHGDTVQVLLQIRTRPDKKEYKNPKGKVIKVISRAKSEFVGVLKVLRDSAFVITDDRKIKTDILIPLNDLKIGRASCRERV